MRRESLIGPPGKGVSAPAQQTSGAAENARTYRKQAYSMFLSASLTGRLFRRPKRNGTRPGW